MTDTYFDILQVTDHIAFLPDVRIGIPECYAAADPGIPGAPNVDVAVLAPEKTGISRERLQP